MAIGNYVREKQPFVSKTFSNALENGRLAHSYLLLGESGTPLKETAIFMAKSILCDHPNPLADETCPTCNRIEKGEYPDYVLCDGSLSSIKKEDIAKLVGAFQQTALERKGIMVYVVHLVENMTTEAVNALLKFLEEPPSHAYAILTTENPSRVLPTIISRCQCIRTLLYPREQVVEEALKEGIPSLDAELLSHFYNDVDLLKQAKESEDYQLAKSLFMTTVDALTKTEAEARFLIERDVIPQLSKKSAIRAYFDDLALAFEDILRLRSKSKIHLASIQESIAELEKKFPNAAMDLSDLMALRNEIDLNIAAGLLITHFLFLLYHRKKDRA